jgi:chromate reductase
LTNKLNIFVIVGSASKHSANQKIVDRISVLTKDFFNLDVLNDLKTLPHFDPELSADSPPQAIIELRENINKADGVVICTPEYIFSVPSGLKNMIEWCVATTVFSDKPVGLITASLGGQQAHEELKMLMRTLTAKFIQETVLLIQGVKGKIDQEGQITDQKTIDNLDHFINAFKGLVLENKNTANI